MKLTNILGFMMAGILFISYLIVSVIDDGTRFQNIVLLGLSFMILQNEFIDMRVNESYKSRTKE